MKLYEVVTEHDGVPEGFTTPIVTSRYYFGAYSIDEVWNHIDWLVNDPERTVISISQVVEQFDVVPTVVPTKEK